MKLTYSFKAIILSCFLALLVAGCSDGTNQSNPVTSAPVADNTPDTTPPPPPGIIITGTVTAPGGTVAQLEGKNTYFHLAANFIITPTYADIIGLLPVGNGTAELIEVDDNGAQVGAVLASAPLSITGEYSLELPSGRALAANLVVRISSGGVSMRAMVVDQVVDINPISEYVLQKFVDDDTLTLADIPVGQVIALQGRVREFDLTAEANLSGMLARLEADLGELVELEIEDIESAPADDTAASDLAARAAGTWNTVDFGLSLHDNEENTFGTFNMSIFSESISITADATNPGEVDVATTGILIDSWSNLSFDDRGSTLFNELILDDLDDENFSGALDTNGNLVVETPFEEELQTGACPMFGWRYPPSKIFVDNTGNDNALVTVTRDVGVRYRTVDTTGGSCPNAIDPAQKDGDEASVELTLVLKAGEGTTAASLNGDYGFVSLYTEISSSGGGIIATSTVGQANFDGVGLATVPSSGLDEMGFNRSPITGGAVLGAEGPGEPGPLPIEYTVVNGVLTLVTETRLEGYVNADGSIFGLVDINVDDTGGVVNVVDQEILIGVKLPASAPILEGAVYRLTPLVFGADTNGSTEIFTFGRNNRLTFGATTATFAGTIRGYERNSDTGPVAAFSEEDDFTFTLDGPGTNGAIAMTFAEPGSTLTVKGFVSADGSTMILRLFEVGETDRLVGIMLGIKQ